MHADNLLYTDPVFTYTLNIIAYGYAPKFLSAFVCFQRCIMAAVFGLVCNNCFDLMKQGGLVGFHTYYIVIVAFNNCLCCFFWQ